MKQSGRKTGVVVRFERDFGFIRPDDGSRTVYVHYSSILESDAYGFRTLSSGQKVEFGVVDSRRSPEAVAVKVLKEKQTCLATK